MKVRIRLVHTLSSYRIKFDVGLSISGQVFFCLILKLLRFQDIDPFVCFY